MDNSTEPASMHLAEITRTSCLGVWEAHFSDILEPLLPLEREKLLLLEEAMMLFLCLILWLGPCTADTEMLADRDELESMQNKELASS